MSAKKKTEKTEKATVQTEKTVEVKSPVNDAIYKLLQGVNDDSVLNTLSPYPNVDKAGNHTNWWSISGGELDDALEGVSFNLLIDLPITNKKGKVISTKEVNLNFTVTNIKEGHVWSTGTIAKFSSLKISAFLRTNTITPKAIVLTSRGNFDKA